MGEVLVVVPEDEAGEAVVVEGEEISARLLDPGRGMGLGSDAFCPARASAGLNAVSFGLTPSPSAVETTLSRGRGAPPSAPLQLRRTGCSSPPADPHRRPLPARWVSSRLHGLQVGRLARHWPGGGPASPKNVQRSANGSAIEGLAAFPAGLQAAQALGLHGSGLAHLGRRGAGRGLYLKENALAKRRRHEPQGSSKSPSVSREAHDEVGGQGDVGARRPDPVDDPPVLVAGVPRFMARGCGPSPTARAGAGRA
jgi:hypothetical protein